MTTFPLPGKLSVIASVLLFTFLLGLLSIPTAQAAVFSCH